MCGDYFQCVCSVLSCNSAPLLDFVCLQELTCSLKELIVIAKRNGYVELANVIHAESRQIRGPMQSSC
jgi:hypothetical protein